MKPILFNTEMVRALLEGRKTVTRRLIKPRYREDEYGFQVITRRNGEFVRVEKTDENECGIFPDGTERYVNPPYEKGDMLYVRETWTYHEGAVGGIMFKARCPANLATTKKWHPSIHMPREAARIFLRVTGVRVERLQEITEEQARCEGVQRCREPRDVFSGAIEKQRFYDLWQNTIKPADLPLYGWDANPWVWVIEFERISKEETV